MAAPAAPFANQERHNQPPNGNARHADPDSRRAALVCGAKTGGRDCGPARRGGAELATARTRRQCPRAGLCRQGVKPGDFVAIGLPNSNAFFETTFAVWKCGATPTSLSWRLPRGEAAAVLEILKPSLVVGGEADWNAPNSLPVGFVPEGFSDEPLVAPVARYWKAMTSGGSTGPAQGDPRSPAGGDRHRGRTAAWHQARTFRCSIPARSITTRRSSCRIARCLRVEGSPA